MAAINTAITRFFDLVFAASAVNPWLGMVLLSLLTGFVLLFIFRFTSNQQGIRSAKNRIMAHLLEVLLHRDELRIVMRAQFRLAFDNLRYLGYALVPLAFMIIPVGLLLIQTDLRFGHRSLKSSESAIVQIKVGPQIKNLEEVSLIVPEGIELETDSLRMPSEGEVDWRVRAKKPGRYQLIIDVAGKQFTKDLVVETTGGRVATERFDGPAWRYFVNPGEPPLQAGGVLESIKVNYPTALFSLFGWSVHWVWVWLILSMLFGFAFKGPLRVQV